MSSLKISSKNDWNKLRIWFRLTVYFPHTDEAPPIHIFRSPLHPFKSTYLNLLFRLLISRDINSWLSAISSHSLWNFLFWAFSLLISSSASSSWRLKAFIRDFAFSTCSLYWSTCLRSSSSCMRSSFSFLSSLRLVFCWVRRSLASTWKNHETIEKCNII